MSEDEWRRKRRRRDPWFSDDFFLSFERLSRLMEEEFERIFRGPSIPEWTSGMRPHVYGFSVSIGPDGKPVVREFGNVKSGRAEPSITEEREPLVDIMSEGEEVVVVAEVPGVEKDDIKLNVTEDGLTISVSAENRKYFKDLKIPEKIDPDSTKVSYNNGVLEVTVKKIKAGKSISVN